MHCKLAAKYAIFALVATSVNLASQDVVTRLYAGSYSIGLAILVGTAVGLVVKYLLDKRYIFSFTPNSLSHDGKIFVLYTVMGLATTVIFGARSCCFTGGLRLSSGAI